MYVCHFQHDDEFGITHKIFTKVIPQEYPAES